MSLIFLCLIADNGKHMSCGGLRRTSLSSRVAFDECYKTFNQSQTPLLIICIVVGWAFFN